VNRCNVNTITTRAWFHHPASQAIQCDLERLTYHTKVKTHEGRPQAYHSDTHGGIKDKLTSGITVQNNQQRNELATLPSRKRIVVHANQVCVTQVQILAQANESAT
jgi:hypothetical protein